MDKISLGFDIATSISIIGAVISFMLSQKKARKQSQAQYSVSNLKDFLKYLSNCGRRFDDEGNQLRENPTLENLKKNRLQVIFLLEDLKRELKAQIEIYFLIFSAESKTPIVLKDKDNELNELISLAKSDEDKFPDVLSKIEPFLNDLELKVALELKKIIRES